MREKIRFDSDWLFHRGDIEIPFPRDKGPVYTQSKTERMLWGPAARHYLAQADDFSRAHLICTDYWEKVTLPHDYVIRGELSQEENSTLGYLPYPNAWYRKTFTLTEEDMTRRLTLLFDGVATHATVYLNGCLLKHNFCGYTSFSVNISDVAECGKNVLAVYVETDSHEGWWYEGGGIYRHVWLCKTDPVAVALWGVFAAPQKLDADTWQVNLETEINNDSDVPVIAWVETRITAPDGTLFAAARGSVEIPARDTATLKNAAVGKSPLLWDLDSPTLYTVETHITVDGVERDVHQTRIGFRTVEIDAERGLFLNGRHVKLKGVCAHQDFGITGKAVADNVQRYRIQMIREMGANAYRTSHYPHAEATMDALDELGILVMDETRWFDSSEEGREQLAMLVKRDRNRPSVIFWSIGNEEPHHTTDVGRRICRRLRTLVNKLDGTRPVTTAVSDHPEEATVYEDCDVIGINYNLQAYDVLHKKYPNKPIFSSECCATGTTRGWYEEDFPAQGRVPAYDRDTTRWFLGREKTWKFMCERTWILGAFQWTSFEHRGETVWPRLCSVSGAIDMFLQKKDAFYQNQSHWTHEPMIHLLPHWNFAGREGETMAVWAYTNCEEAELFLNGESLGRVPIEKYGHGAWQVPYQPGELSVVGLRGGTVVCTDEKITSGRAEKLWLRLENTVTANGEDVAIITCGCKDAVGHDVPDASPFVRFRTNGLGTVIGTGSDNTDHVAPCVPQRQMYAGRITVAVRVGRESGTLRVYAEADGLTTAVLTIEL